MPALSEGARKKRVRCFLPGILRDAGVVGILLLRGILAKGAI